MASWYSRPNTVEMADGTEKTEYHLCFETFDREEAKHIEGVFKAVMDGKDINIPGTNVGDTISRQAAIEKFAMTAPQMSTIHVYEAVDILDSLPSAQPERTGHWIHHPDWEADGECGYECSECHMGSEIDTNYCPRCGAHMVEKGGETE